MANLNASFGLIPWGPILHTSRYAIVTEYATAVFVGDPMGMTGASYATRFGQGIPGCEIQVAGAAGAMLGGVIAVEDYTGHPLLYLPASTAGDGVVAGYVTVADHPMQEWVIQEDGDTTPVAAASVGLNADLIATNAGSTVTGRSGIEIDSDSVNVTATLAVHILRAHPFDTIASANCRFICQIKAHYLGANVVGIS